MKQETSRVKWPSQIELKFGQIYSKLRNSVKQR